MLTIKFMTELGKQLGNGGVITFKAGRKGTKRGAGFSNLSGYYADTCDIKHFSNTINRIIFGYEKSGQFVELGAIGNKDDSFYVIPNPLKADFWAKCGLNLLQKSGIKLDEFLKT